jgi:hypothetical protein
VWAVLDIVVLQVLTEPVVGRNYAVALLFITPLALVGAVVLLLVPDRKGR